MPDIDIDFVDRDQALKLFKHVPASRIDNDRLVKHNTGVYLHSVPASAAEAVCSVPYDHTTAEEYFKIDFLNVGIYKGVKDEAHLIQLMEKRAYAKPHPPYQLCPRTVAFLDQLKDRNPKLLQVLVESFPPSSFPHC